MSTPGVISDTAFERLSQHDQLAYPYTFWQNWGPEGHRWTWHAKNKSEAETWLAPFRQLAVVSNRKWPTDASRPFTGEVAQEIVNQLLADYER